MKEKMVKPKLFLDFDDVIINTGKVLTEIVKEFYPWALKKHYEEQISLLIKYKNDVISSFKKQDLEELNKIKLGLSNKTIDEWCHNGYRYLSQIHTLYDKAIEELEFDKAYSHINLDYLLEVLNNESKRRIYNADGVTYTEVPYVDYDSLLHAAHEVDDAFKVVELLNKQNAFTLFCLTHINSKQEIMKKREFCNKHLQSIPVLSIPFHLEKFNVLSNRRRSSKAKCVMKLYGINELNSNYILIDDSKENIDDWIKCGGRGILFTKNDECIYPDQIQEMTEKEFRKKLILF